MKFIKHPYGNKKIAIVKFFKNFIKITIKFVLGFIFKFDKNDEIIISSAVHAPWLKDKKFYQFYNKINHLTLLDEYRAYTLWQCSKNLRNMDGNILDIGCLFGGAGFLMSKINNKGNTYLFDTFSGFKKNDGIHQKDIFYFKDISYVKKSIKLLKLNKTKVYKSYFPNDLKFPLKKIKLCHIDVNTYTDTKNVFEYIQDKMTKNGIIIFDDYGIWGVDGVKKLIDKIIPKYEKKFIFIKNYMGQCIMVKK